MGCLAYRTVALFILQALHCTVEKHLTHSCHPMIIVHCKKRKFQEKKLRKFWMLWASIQ